MFRDALLVRAAIITPANNPGAERFPPVTRFEFIAKAGSWRSCRFISSSDVGFQVYYGARAMIRNLTTIAWLLLAAGACLQVTRPASARQDTTAAPDDSENPHEVPDPRRISRRLAVERVVLGAEEKHLIKRPTAIGPNIRSHYRCSEDH